MHFDEKTNRIYFITIYYIEIMNESFHPLVTLENKPIITNNNGVKIHFHSEEQPKLKIVDKTNKGVGYRKNILDRLKNNNINIPFVKSELKEPLAGLSVPIIEPEKRKATILIQKKQVEVLPEKVDISETIVDISETVDINEEDMDKQIEELSKILDEDTTVVQMIEEPKAKRGRKSKKVTSEGEDTDTIDLTTAVIRTQKVIDRLPKEKEKSVIPTSPYYMNNRKLFIQKLTNLFQKYREGIVLNENNISCESRGQGDEFELLLHQKVVRDYLNLYTPYRGLLLYHGLGSGKTCTSIAIGEGMKTNKRVFVLTPASLKMNFLSEMKKCGDELYKKNQYWEFISVEGKPDYIKILSKALSLSSEYIKNNGGAWLVNINKEANYVLMQPDEQKKIDEQLNEMIRSKYTDINYNGLNMNRLNLLTGDMTHNPFDNAVVIIDEAHNFVSRIVNKIKKDKKGKTIPSILYELILSAKNARIVLLSGTPIINYPNEIAILFNILRGYIKTWTFTINVKTSEKINTNAILDMFDKENLRTFDFVEYNGNVLTVTRNPFGFINTKKRGNIKGTRKIINKGGSKTKKARMDGGSDDGHSFEKYNGVKLDESGNISDNDFQNKVISILTKNNLEIQKNSIKVSNYKALPDDYDTFFKRFINNDTGEFININVFQRRILGLTSYFRSAQEQLLPSYVKTEQGDIYHVVKTEMSPHQYGVYSEIRLEELKNEEKTKKVKQIADQKGVDAEDLFKISSTYRVFSRAACNFTFPNAISRPGISLGNEDEVSENDFDAIQDTENDDEEKPAIEQSYFNTIAKALKEIATKKEGTNESKYLSKEELPIYSAKLAKVLENIQSPENEGLHLLYSHFRTIEGIGIMKLILEANGYAEFVIKKINDRWDIIEREEDAGKPRFVLYTGTETAEEKEIIRNIYNGDWGFVPNSIVDKLKKIAENNIYGEVIKVLMITSSGAEGINLKNTRFVHIVEPYWHMVRVDQVVGRARRICSHQQLPLNMRTVKVFLYVSTMSEQQKTSEDNITLRIKDVSKIDRKTPFTTDESLYEIASIKQKTNNQILKLIKETAIDCQLYSAVSSKKDDSEGLVCYNYGKIESNQFSSYPSFENDLSSKEGLDVKAVKINAVKITINGMNYALNNDTMDVYDYESYLKAKESGSEPTYIGKLVKQNGQYKLVNE